MNKQIKNERSYLIVLMLNRTLEQIGDSYITTMIPNPSVTFTPYRQNYHSQRNHDRKNHYLGILRRILASLSLATP